MIGKRKAFTTSFDEKEAFEPFLGKEFMIGIMMQKMTTQFWLFLQSLSKQKTHTGICRKENLCGYQANLFALRKEGQRYIRVPKQLWHPKAQHQHQAINNNPKMRELATNNNAKHAHNQGIQEATVLKHLHRYKKYAFQKSFFLCKQIDARFGYLRSSQQIWNHKKTPSNSNKAAKMTTCQATT